ncbi:MAG TPA: M48 family metalloprotease [Oscillatoriaceae cyanobacterium M33_DOE_052]|uniref:Peptidase M48 n=1 Tax=Planktothricoides sp. SpSt-374 TaxID=2282167 RepID=A0A7C3ZZY0_9CYAN|nr:M48 family metalloprotease [Oscillatoriaceae cyanobacterium M33_DOE_052]
MSEPSEFNNTQESSSFHKAGRGAMAGVKLAAAVGGNLVVASGVTMTLIFGMVLVLCLAVTLIIDSSNPAQGLAIALGVTLLFNTAAFFLSPWIMDLTQQWLYHTRWVDMTELESKSPETAAVIARVCAEKQLKQPRLGIIDDQNPTAFTYGSLRNSARLVVSEGLFTYLDDDEIATVYAHELGHIVHWDFAVMTVASTLVQITYLIYNFARRLGRSGGEKAKDAAQTVALVAYIFYLVGTYLLLYLSRTREYFADHFAAETTGNPNALSRALVKIAYGLVEEGKRSKEPSVVMEGTRALGIYDHKAAASTGTAYRIAAAPDQIGRVFSWDIFNPWGWWMELNSTHPLTGKRVRALSTYAEQLGLEVEFDMARTVREGNQLNKGKLYGNFILDLGFYSAPSIGFFAGLVMGLFLSPAGSSLGFIAVPLIGLGIGILIKTLVSYPNYGNAPATDVLTLMSDPYASPLRGKPAQLQGDLIGRGDAGYAFGSDLQLQDRTGLMFLHYCSRFGPIGNFLFGMKKAKSLIGMQVDTVGWFRRGVAPWMDLIELRSDSGTVVNSYHRFWSFLVSGGLMLLGVFLLLR